MMTNKSVTLMFPRRVGWLTAAVLIAAIGAVGLQGWSTMASESLVAPVVPVALVPGATQPADDYFLEIDGIEGELEIDSFSWGANQAGAHGAGGGGGAGKVQMQDFHFVMKTGKASAKLFLACASGQHIKEVVLTVRKAGGTQQEYLVVRLTDVLVSSFQSGGSGDLGPTDEVSLNYTKIHYSVHEIMPDGSVGAPASTSYDVGAGVGQ
jgi:type VI secretion system secreted protein Hcp